MQSINDRVKLLRKKLGLTQIEFGEKILMSQGQLTSVELGKRNVTDRTVKLICSEFQASEKWLRTGEGPMFSGRQSLIDELAAKYKFEDYVRKMLEEYIKLDPTRQAVVLDYAHHLVASILAETDPAPQPDEIDREVENYRAQLESEKEAETSHQSRNGNEITA